MLEKTILIRYFCTYSRFFFIQRLLKIVSNSRIHMSFSHIGTYTFIKRFLCRAENFFLLKSFTPNNCNNSSQRLKDREKKRKRVKNVPEIHERMTLPVLCTISFSYQRKEEEIQGNIHYQHEMCLSSMDGHTVVRAMCTVQSHISF